jgi:hypothetical protein
MAIIVLESSCDTLFIDVEISNPQFENPSRSGDRFENSLFWRGNQTVYNYSIGIPIIVMYKKEIKMTSKNFLYTNKC